MKSKRVFASMVLLLLCVTIASLPLVGQKTGPKYDASTETKLKGTVVEIKDVPGAYEGTHVMFKSGDQTVLVHLAPPEFLDMLDFKLKVGDNMTIIGSKITVDGSEEVLARTIEEGTNSITLRDDKGAPAWGWMKLKD